MHKLIEYSIKNEVFLSVLIFILSFIIRSVKITDYLFFGFEQGRDAQVIENIYKLQDFVLAGPATSVGGIFHGPWYYYVMAIPYGLGGGDPLAASFFLVMLGSLVPVVMYFLGKEIFKSKWWGLVGSILAVFSYEYILYSRWLSNVSPAPLFIALSFLMAWKFIITKKRKFFLLFSLFAGFASTFELLLLPEFIFLFLLLIFFKQFKDLSGKTLLGAAAILLLIFSPLILFDFRNEHIIFNSILGLAGESSGGGLDGIRIGFVIYIKQLYTHLSLSLFNIQSLPIQIAIFIMILLNLFISLSKKENHKPIIFLLSLVLMSFPVMKISPGDPQHYVGIGLGWILIFCFVLKNLWNIVGYKYILLVLGSLFIVSFYFSLEYLLTNRNVFFRTIQDDLVYSDQKTLLGYVNEDSRGLPYELISFTIPSLQPQGWEYLHKHFYPNAGSQNAKIIYITIEKGVYPVWENKWIAELGKTNLEYERKFGLIRLQKRIVE